MQGAPAEEELDERLAFHLSRVLAAVDRRGRPEPRTSRLWAGKPVPRYEEMGLRVLSLGKGLPDEEAASLLVVLLDLVPDRWVPQGLWSGFPDLARRKLPFTATDVALIVRLAERVDGPPENYGTGPWQLRALKAAAAAAGRLSPEERADLGPVLHNGLEQLERYSTEPNERARLRVRLRELAGVTGADPEIVDLSMLHRDDGWGPAAAARLGAFATGQKAVNELMSHCSTATSGPRPTKRWAARARELIGPSSELMALVRDLLADAVNCRPVTVVHAIGDANFTYAIKVGPLNEDLVQGLVWAAVVLDSAWSVPSVETLAADQLRHEQSKLANACFAVLGSAARPESVAALAWDSPRTVEA